MVAKGTTTYGSRGSSHSSDEKDDDAITTTAQAPEASQDKAAQEKAALIKQANEAVIKAKQRKSKTDEPIEASQMYLLELDPSVPMTQEELEVYGRAKTAIARTEPAGSPPMTDEAQKLEAEDAKLPPPVTKQATPLASATNPALMRNDVDVTKTPPYPPAGASYAPLQG
jgi:hypothetical protein